MEYLSVALTVTLAAIASAFSQSIAARAAMEGTARQPEAAGDIRTTLILALAFIEALTLFCFVAAILIWIRIS
ncbi:MAG: ATP synthase F0 subunit C [Dethiobacteria bacterium]|nr:ATP synthase F0 subunit C [Bacillota bacterium]HOJ83342.1 ATP synthase F0 subunit C [Bacillota bacterium]HOL15678.1 ATP synthase F0 subunit C [Bacillota bacterium]